MKHTLRVLLNMGQLHRIAPFWIVAIWLLASHFSAFALIAFAYGMLLQFLTEYVLHRFVYHKQPAHAQSLFNQQYRAHIGHHEYPADPEFFTGGDNWYALKLGVLTFLAHAIVLWPFLGLQTAGIISWIAVFGGSITAYTFYEYCHTLAHLKVPKGRFGTYVTRTHLAHHYQDHHATFHVSAGMGWIDRLFGTPHDAQAAKARFDRHTLLSIGMDPDDLRLVEARKAFGLSNPPGSPRAR